MTPEAQTYEAIIAGVADKLNLPAAVVDKTYKAYWKFIREMLSTLPLKEDLTEVEFEALRTSVNVPSLGKFVCDYDRYKRIRKRIEYIKRLQEDDNQEN